MRKKFEGGGKVCFDVDNPKIRDVLPENIKNPRKVAAKGGRIEYSKGTKRHPLCGAEAEGIVPTY